MFIVVSIEDKLKVMPDEFDRPTADVLLERIQAKYVNKVLPEVGLCIAFYDFVEVGDPYVYPAEGASHQLVKFRLVVFRPFVGEVMVGKIKACTKEGVQVSMDFFDDVIIPSYSLQIPSEYHNKTWVWSYGEDQSFVMAPGDIIRFRVSAINFSQVVTTARGVKSTTLTTLETSNNNNSNAAAIAAAVAEFGDEGANGNDASSGNVRRRSTSVDLSLDRENPPPMRVIGCANEDGLGLVVWWSS